MKMQFLKKQIAFIIALMICSLLPEFAAAQTVKKQRCYWSCPKGFICFNGHCIRYAPFLTGDSPVEAIAVSSANTNAISFQLMHAQHVSAKIYDATGSLVKTIADSKMLAGYHQMMWGAKDDTGNPVLAGVYFLRMNADNYPVDKKMIMVR